MRYVAVVVAVAVRVAVVVGVALAVEVGVGVPVAVAVGVGVGVAGGLTPAPVVKSQCEPPFRNLPFSAFTVPLILTAYLVLIDRLFDGVRIAVAPAQAMVPAMRFAWPGPSSVKLLALIV